MNYIEVAHDTLIKNPKPESGAALVHKYKGIRLFDDEDCETYRVRSDFAEFVGKKRGGWALLCDKMPSINPANDPEGDYDYASGSEEDPEKYIINEVLHDMISEAMQAPGVLLVGPDASDKEEEAEGDDKEEGNESAEEEQDEEEVEDKEEGK